MRIGFIGLDPHAMIEVLNHSTGPSWVGRTHFQQRIFNRAFDDPFKLGLMVKDMTIALRVAEEAGVPAPLSQTAATLWREIGQDEGPGSSVSRLIAGMEARSGVTLTPGSRCPEPRPMPMPMRKNRNHEARHRPVGPRRQGAQYTSRLSSTRSGCPPRPKASFIFSMKRSRRRGAAARSASASAACSRAEPRSVQ